MRDSAFGPIALPESFWHRPEVSAALASRDMGELFRLLHFKAKISQTRIATATVLSQGRVSAIVNGKQDVRSLAVFRRIADGLDMTEHARLLLGVATDEPATAVHEPVSLSEEQGHERDLLRQLASAGNIDTGVVQVLQEETNAVRLLDRRLGAPRSPPNSKPTSAT